MQPHRPDVQPASPSDFSVPRIAARTSGSSGFLFVNNHVREYAMPAHDNFQVTITLPGDKSVTLPGKPVTLPADAYFVWPFNMDLGGLHLRFATAQPLAILGTKDAPVYAFFSQPGIPAEFVIDDTAGLTLDPQSILQHPLEVTHEGGELVLRQTGAIDNVYRGFMPVFKLLSGKVITILLLSENEALHSWKMTSKSGTLFVWTPQQAYVDGDHLTLENQNLGDGSRPFGPDVTHIVIPFDIGLLMPLDATGHETMDLHSLEEASKMASLNRAPPVVVPLAFQQTKAADAPAPLPAGFAPSSRPRVVAAAPIDADWSRAATYSIPLPKYALIDTPAEQHFLRITYTGDIARISVNGRLLDDNFADGRPWLIGLDRFAPQITQSGGKLDFSIYPLRANAPIFFESGNEPKPGTPPAALQSVELLTQYTLRLKLEPLTPQKK